MLVLRAIFWQKLQSKGLGFQAPEIFRPIPDMKHLQKIIIIIIHGIFLIHTFFG
jgi:hypothetical protein